MLRGSERPPGFGEVIGHIPQDKACKEARCGSQVEKYNAFYNPICCEQATLNSVRSFKNYGWGRPVEYANELWGDCNWQDSEGAKSNKF